MDTKEWKPLPPSVEKAYRIKCIQLRRRRQEIEADNDRMRKRLAMLNRVAMQLRMERAIMLDHIRRVVKREGWSSEEEESSDEEEVMPDERPPPVKRARRSGPNTGVTAQLTTAATAGSSNAATQQGTTDAKDLPSGIADNLSTLESAIQPPDSSDIIEPPASVLDWFIDHLVNAVMRFRGDFFSDEVLASEDAKVAHAREIWAELEDDVKDAWITAYDELLVRYKKAQDKSEWGRIAGGSRRGGVSAVAAAAVAEKDGDEEV